MRLHRRNRRAVTCLELALVTPVTISLLLGMIVGGLGVFRDQQVARLARDASRWAAVHGADYASETGKSAATASDVYNQVIAPNAVGLDLAGLTYSVVWNTNNSTSHTATVAGQQVNVSNTVTVTVNYQWMPEAYFSGATLSSSSVSVMSY